MAKPQTATIDAGDLKTVVKILEALTAEHHRFSCFDLLLLTARLSESLSGSTALAPAADNNAAKPTWGAL